MLVDDPRLQFQYAGRAHVVHVLVLGASPLEKGFFLMGFCCFGALQDGFDGSSGWMFTGGRQRFPLEVGRNPVASVRHDSKASQCVPPFYRPFIFWRVLAQNR